jgi:hypothetical protein
MEVQPKNLAAVIEASGQFSLAAGTTTVAAAQAAGYRDFGNIVGLTLSPKGTTKEHMGAYNGIRKVDKSVVTELRLGYKVEVDEASAQNISFHYYGTLGTNYSQAAKSAVAVDALTTPVKGVWYDLLISGVRYRNLTVVAIVSTPSVVENTDYVVDYKTGRIRFITTPPGTLTSISITCAAIATTDATSMYTITPNNKPIVRGIARALIYDTEGNFIAEHEGMYCEIYPDGTVDFDGTKYAEIGLDVNVVAGQEGTVHWAV